MFRDLIRNLYYFFKTIFINFNFNNVRVHYTSKIKKNSVFLGNNRISSYTFFSGHMGRNSYIGSRSVLYGHIGNYCSIGSNVRTIIGTHPTNFISTSPVFFSTLNQTGKTFINKTYFTEVLSISINKKLYGVKIGNDVWIGDAVLIKGGVTIGDGSIIGMGSVVIKDVEPYSIVGGVPAKLIRYRFSSDQINRLLSLKWWYWNENKIYNYLEYMTNIDIFLDKCK